MRDTIIITKEHFYNGFDHIVSARYEGEEETFLFYTIHGYEFGRFFTGYEQMTEEQENLYRKHNSLLIERIDNEIRT